MSRTTFEPKRYRVGIDVGSRSLGCAAIEVDADGTPVSILNAMSHIHDGGVDPDSHKTALTRKFTSGVARRTRRMYAQRKKRLAALDSFLAASGYPLRDLATNDEKTGWKARAELATTMVSNSEQQKQLISDAVRHIARHRGWRNPYSTTKSLKNPSMEHSPAFLAIREQFEEALRTSLPSDFTLAQMVMALPDATTKLRGEGGLFSERLHQKDLAMEIQHIAKIQQLEPKLTSQLIDKVFAAKSPKGSAVERVGKDPLDPSQFRAWRATRAFQEYRIIALLVNVRIKERNALAGPGTIRCLTVEERNRVFEFLNSYSEKERPGWAQVAEVLGIDRGDLKGTATSTDDGERVSAFPPINDTARTLAQAPIKEIRDFWNAATPRTQDALIREFSNVEAPQEDSPEAIAAATVLRSLPEEAFEKLESIRLPDGRAAYSEKTLQKLTEYMLNNEADLHSARRAIFGVPDDWKPTPAPIHEQTGNPAVDRVLKAINRWLLMAESRWGRPATINIETLRDGFKSEKTARELERSQNQRAKRNLEHLASMQETLKIEGKPRRSELLRHQAIQRQNGQCAYCGTPIDFKTAELDHIVPRAGVGSTNARYNLLAVCGRCNRAKGKLPFAVWAKKANINGVSLEAAVERVSQWPTDPGLNKKEMARFKSDVILRLKRVSEDDELDARSKEAVSWMAVELHNRLKGHYAAKNEEPQVGVHVFRGEVTSSARKASGIDKSFQLLGGKPGKNRLDRRHHAIDASVIALMQPTVAQVLTERNSLRSQQRLTGIPDQDYGDWKVFSGRTIEAQIVFRRWAERMKVLVPLLQDAIDQDRVPVVENLRLRLGNGLAHEETIHALKKLPIGSAIPANIVDRAATPALWTALTRHKDFDWKEGLPEDPSRTITVNGQRLQGSDFGEFFSVNAGALKMRGGFVELGSSFHHARLYKIRGPKKTVWAMMRVYTTDLLRFRNEDLFTVELPESSMSVRQSEPKLRQAFREGTATFVTWFVVGDELLLKTENIATGQARTFLDAFPGTNRWRIRGFFTVKQLRLKPSQLANEGLNDETHSDVRKVIDSPGWLPSVSKLFGNGQVIIVRRDAHGEVRLNSRRGLPTTIRVE